MNKMLLEEDEEIRGKNVETDLIKASSNMCTDMDIHIYFFYKYFPNYSILFQP